MSNEVRELKQHINWLQDQLEDHASIDDLTQISDLLGDTNESVDALWKSVEGLCDIQRQFCDAQRQFCETQVLLLDAFRKLLDVLTPKNPPAPPPSIFDEVFNDLPKRAKRQKFKPKVVKNDQPDEPGAA